MAKKIAESIDRELKLLETRGDFGGPKISEMCDTLERVMRELKIFDQKRHRCEQMEDDINRRFEAIVLSIERMTKILKDNGLLAQNRE